MKSQQKGVWGLCFGLAFLAAQSADGVAAADKAAAKEAWLGRVTGSEVRVRCGPSLNHHTLGFLKRGQEVVVTGAEEGWAEIKIPRHLPVYISKQFVDASGKVTGRNVWLRPAPNVTSAPVGKVQPGVQLGVIGEKDGWYKVEPPQQARGFLADRYVERLGGLTQADLDRLASKAQKPLVGSATTKKPVVVPGSLRVGSRFHAAYLVFEEESKKKNFGDLDRVRAALNDVIESSKDLTEVAAAHQFLSTVSFFEEQKQAAVRHQEAIAKSEAKLKLLQAKSAVPGELSMRKDPYLAAGWISGQGLFVRKVGTHKLMKGQRLLYYIRSDRLDLDRFIGKRVGIVSGVVKRLAPEDGADLLVIDEIRIFYP